MTNAQKWVTVFLVLFVLLLALAKFTSKKEKADESSYSEKSTSSSEVQEINVENLLANNKCYTCHGKDLNGSGMAPTLANISQNWNAANLVSYFENPKAFLNNPRMVVLKDKYKSEMPAVKNLTMEELNALAEYLLDK